MGLQSNRSWRKAEGGEDIAKTFHSGTVSFANYSIVSHDLFGGVPVS